MEINKYTIKKRELDSARTQMAIIYTYMYIYIQISAAQIKGLLRKKKKEIRSIPSNRKDQCRYPCDIHLSILSTFETKLKPMQ